MPDLLGGERCGKHVGENHPLYWLRPCRQMDNGDGCYLVLCDACAASCAFFVSMFQTCYRQGLAL